MAHGVHVPYGSVWKNDSRLHFKISLFTDCRIKRLLGKRPILGVPELFYQIDIQSCSLRIQVEDAKKFARPKNLTGGNIPSPTPRVAESLRFGQVGFTAPQLFIGALARGDFFGERHDEPRHALATRNEGNVVAHPD